MQYFTVFKNGTPVTGVINLSYTNILTFNYFPWDATVKSATVTTSDMTIALATINASDGTITVTPRKIGTTNLIVTINGMTQVFPVSVTFVPVITPVVAIDIRDGTDSINWVTISGTKQLNLVILPSDATNRDATLTVGDTGIITASIDNATGIITLVEVSPGTTSLTATVDGQSKQISVTVDGGTNLRGFNIVKNTTVISSDYINANTTYGIQLIPAEAEIGSITAVSSAPSKATVSVNAATKQFTVTPVTDGQTTITVTIGTKTKTLVITVYGKRVTTINVKDCSANITKVAFTGTKTLGIEVLPTTAVNKTFTATIGNASVATVSANNTNKTVTLTAVAASGTTTLTITADGISTVITVNVVVIPLDSIDIRDGSTSVSSSTIYVEKNYNVVLNPINATFSDTSISVNGYDATVLTATYDAGAKMLHIVPLKAGTTTVHLNIGGVSDTLTVTIPQIYAASLDIQHSGVSMVSDSISAGKTYDVIVTPSNTTNKAITAVSSNNGIATVAVSGQTFTVTPVSDGITTITVTNTSSGITKTLLLNVSGIRVKTVNIKDGATIISSTTINTTKTLNVEILPATAINKIITASVANTAIASVSIDNVNKQVTLIPNATGTTALTVTVDGISQAITVVVSNIPVTGITITGSASVLTGTRTLTATISPTNASNKGVVWSTSNSARISISSTSGASITITARGNGTATITARSAANSAIVDTVTISADVGQTLTSVTLGSYVKEPTTGLVFQLVDKGAHYGLGYTYASGHTTSSLDYSVFIVRSNVGTSIWHNQTSGSQYYSNASSHTTMTNTWFVNLPASLKNLSLNVRFPLKDWSDTEYLSAYWPLAMPSVNELGYKAWGSYPLKEGVTLDYYLTTPASFPSTVGTWTRTRIWDTVANSRDIKLAVKYESNGTVNQYIIHLNNAERHPVMPFLNSMKVSYYKDSNGYYVLR